MMLGGRCVVRASEIAILFHVSRRQRGNRDDAHYLVLSFEVWCAWHPPAASSATTAASTSALAWVPTTFEDIVHRHVGSVVM